MPQFNRKFNFTQWNAHNISAGSLTPLNEFRVASVFVGRIRLSFSP